MPTPAAVPVILVVEDDQDLLALVEFAVGDLGAVRTASNAAAARTVAREQAPDLIIMDVLLPDANGLELVKELQAGQQVHVPVLILTGLGSEVEKIRGFEAGADDYLIKPFDVDELRVRSRSLLRMRNAEVGLAARNEELEQSNRAASMQLELSKALTALGDRETVLRRVLSVLPGLLHTHRAVVWLQAPEPAQERAWGVEAVGARAPRRISARAFRRFEEVALDAGGLRVVADTGDPDVPPEAAGSGLGAFVLAAITRGTERLGSLLIGFAAPQQFSDQMLSVFPLLCSQIAIAVDNARLYEELQAQALIDTATGLRNMRYFQRELEIELERSRSNPNDRRVPPRDQRISVLMMDLDKFKQYNDSYGHPVGDEALTRFGQLVQGVLRRYDTLARYGGDEFIVLLPGTNGPAARKLADRLRRQITSTRVRLGEQIEVTFSTEIGVATYPDDGASVADLVRAADDALYAAKRRAGTTRDAADSGP